MIKLNYDDTQYLMSYVQPTVNSTYQVKLLAIFVNGFLTSDGFYKEAWVNNKPKFEIDMPTVFNAAAALDLPIHWRELKSHVSLKRCTVMPEDNKELSSINLDKAVLLGQTLGVVCPDDDQDESHMVYNYEMTWCLLDIKK